MPWFYADNLQKKRGGSGGAIVSYPMTNFSDHKLPFCFLLSHPKEYKSNFGISANDVFSLYKPLLTST